MAISSVMARIGRPWNEAMLGAEHLLNNRVPRPEAGLGTPGLMSKRISSEPSCGRS